MSAIPQRICMFVPLNKITIRTSMSESIINKAKQGLINQNKAKMA